MEWSMGSYQIPLNTGKQAVTESSDFLPVDMDFSSQAGPEDTNVPESDLSIELNSLDYQVMDSSMNASMNVSHSRHTSNAQGSTPEMSPQDRNIPDDLSIGIYGTEQPQYLSMDSSCTGVGRHMWFCQLCNKSFVNNETLQLHIQNQHTSTTSSSCSSHTTPGRKTSAMSTTQKQTSTSSVELFPVLRRSPRHHQRSKRPNDTHAGNLPNVAEGIGSQEPGGSLGVVSANLSPGYLFRHGDRSPVRNYPTDPYKEDSWPQGFGQLSKIGMTQEYHLGQFLKRRYVGTGFLNASYKAKEVYARSTDMDRTLMSAYCVLAGMYPPLDNQTWNKDIKWQPIPVHTVPKDEDYLLSLDNPCPKFGQLHSKYLQNDPEVRKTIADNQLLRVTNPCPRFKKLHPEYMKSDPEVLKVLEDNKDLIQYVAKHAGVKATWGGLVSVLDPLFVEHTHNRSLPDWVMKDNTFERLMLLRDSSMTFGVPQHLAHYRGGQLLKTMVSLMKNNVANASSTQKLYIYSAHDNTVTAFLQTLNVFNKRVPPYTACVLVELHQDQTGKYNVQIFYRNVTVPPMVETTPDALSVLGCESKVCPYEKFLEVAAPSLPSDINDVCGIVPPVEQHFGPTKGTCTSAKSPTTSGNVLVFHDTIPFGYTDDSDLTIAVAILTSLLLLVVIVAVTVCCLKNKKNAHNYTPVAMEMQ